MICTVAEMQSVCRQHEAAVRPISNAHWVTTEPVKFLGHVEFEITECSPSGKAYVDYVRSIGHQPTTAPIEVLYSLKRSHRFEPRQWEKHIRDYHFIKPFVDNGDKLFEITEMRMKEYKQHHTPNLNKSVNEFFNDDVSNHTFVHDDIHLIMAHRERPMYEYMRVDPTKVKCSREKFIELTYEDRVKSVLEEGYVIALERGIIPMLYEGKKLADSESALQWAIMRICTTLTGGWFRDFAVENYPTIWAVRNKDYVIKFLEAVDNGKIKRIQEAL
jgi:hypothetical protein